MKPDPGLYDYLPYLGRPRIEWPGGARLAFWVAPNIEFYELEPPKNPSRASWARPVPDVLNYSYRDYGNRVGIYRIMKALDQHGIRASAPVNAAVAVRYPSLIEEIRRRNWELLGHGLDMDHLHFEGMKDEKALIAKSLSALGKVRGWLSPAKSESFETLDLLAQAGIDYVCDWVNDDMPYEVKTKSKNLYAMPHSADIDDATLLLGMHHDEDELRDQLVDHFDGLYEESAAQGGRIMAISLHPWAIGQPYRIGALESALAHIMRHPGVWPATGAEILDAWKAQRSAQGAASA